MSKFNCFMMNLTGDGWDKHHHADMPNYWSYLKTDQGKNSGDDGTTFSFTNDAYEIAISYSEGDRVQYMMGRRTINQFIRWYIWKVWIGEWFGLRRWLWYYFLKRNVNKMKRTTHAK